MKKLKKSQIKAIVKWLSEDDLILSCGDGLSIIDDFVLEFGPDVKHDVKGVKEEITWVNSFANCGWWVTTESEIISGGGYEQAGDACNENKNVFLTKKDAQSSLAHAQLTHIIGKLNMEDKVSTDLTYITWKYGYGTFDLVEYPTGLPPMTDSVYNRLLNSKEAVGLLNQFFQI